MHPIKRFIERNRQTGTTSALVDLISRVGGYLVVGTQRTKTEIVKNNPQVKNQIITRTEINGLSKIGDGKDKVFFDTDIVYSICEDAKCDCDNVNLNLINICGKLCKELHLTMSIEVREDNYNLFYEIKLTNLYGFPEPVITNTSITKALISVRDELCKKMITNKEQYSHAMKKIDDLLLEADITNNTI